MLRRAEEKGDNNVVLVVEGEKDNVMAAKDELDKVQYLMMVSSINLSLTKIDNIRLSSAKIGLGQVYATRTSERINMSPRTAMGVKRILRTTMVGKIFESHDYCMQRHS